MEIISWSEAKRRGLIKYFTGKPCKRGHISERYVAGGCAECGREDMRRYYAQDPEKHMAKTVAYREAYPAGEWCRQQAYRERNRAKLRADSAFQRAKRLLRVPAWSETEEIKEFYANCPPGFEVDHIYPLQGEFVSGLHVLGNLQYLQMVENRAKRNRWRP